MQTDDPHIARLNREIEELRRQISEIDAITPEPGHIELSATEAIVAQRRRLLLQSIVRVADIPVKRVVFRLGVTEVAVQVFSPPLLPENGAAVITADVDVDATNPSTGARYIVPGTHEASALAYSESNSTTPLMTSPALIVKV